MDVSEKTEYVSEIAEYPQFHGKGSEFFGIWIVNILLSIVTLGFYTPWAKVRTRRYFYEHTTLFSSPFAYWADPAKIFIGYVIVIAFYIFYSVFSIIPLIGVLAFFMLMAFYPWVMFKAHRFRARYSAYRNVSFRFMGQLSDCYVVYLAWAMLIPFTLGLILPFMLFKQSEYFFKNMTYGGIASEFYGRVGYFYKVYLLGALAMFGLFLGVAFFFGMFAGALGSSFDMDAEQGEPLAAAGMVVMVIGFYAGFFLFIFITKAMTMNYCLNHWKLSGYLTFRADIKPLGYAWVMISNLVLTLLTLGFFTPWAKVRMQRYLCSHIEVVSTADLDGLATYAQEQEDAIGDSAADFFDIEFGF